MKKIISIIGIMMLMQACNNGGEQKEVRSDSIPRDSTDKTDVNKSIDPLKDSVKSHLDTSSYERMSNKTNDTVPD